MTVSGCLYPVLAIVLGKTITAFQNSLVDSQKDELLKDGCVRSISVEMLIHELTVCFFRCSCTYSLCTLKKTWQDGRVAVLTQVIRSDFFLLALVGVASLSLEWFCFGSTSDRLAVRIRHRIVQSLLSLPIPFYDKDENSPTALVSFIDQCASNIVGLAGATMGAILESAMTLM
jgi:hypothetical protein